MEVKPQPSRLLAAGVCAAFAAGAVTAVAQEAPLATAGAAPDVVERLVVTAERRAENQQQVPIAVSAYSGADLRLRRLEGGQDLIQAAPNMNYARGNFSGYNLSIRGVGSKFIGNSGENGVSIHENATPITYNRLADAEYFDIDRIEILRGPQGTLYGRNATGGAINIITARPTDDLGGWITGEYGSYDERRFEGVLNIPLNDIMAVRWAGFSLKRDGFGVNSFNGDHVDGRDIKASRLSFRLHPDEAFEVNVLWERFDEDDNRLRAGKQLCISDPGPTAIGPVPVLGLNRGLLSQGCLPGSRYSPAALGAANSAAILSGLYLPIIGLAPQGNLFAGRTQNDNLHDIQAVRDPLYQAREDFYQIDARLDLTPALVLESLTGFNYDRGVASEDYNRVAPSQDFAPVGLAARLFPGGVVNDPQAGPARTLVSFDYYPTRSKEFTQEVRLVSDFKSPWNFSLGAFHSEYRIRAENYIFSNGLTAFAQFEDAIAGIPNTVPFYVDPSFPPNSGIGHNYYVNAADNIIDSDAVFGEIYWRPVADVRLTGGFRLTHTRKEIQPDPVTLLAPPTEPAPPPGSGEIPNPNYNGGRGHPPAPTLALRQTAPTGRFAVEWTPKLGFTDQTMIYASYSHGYKAGGFNTPCDTQSPGCGSVPRTFAPEYVDAYEIGTRNVLAHGAVVLDLTAFHYDYTGYQVSTIINKASVNQNIDARIDGAELESVWEPTRGLRFDLQAGWLRTSITGGAMLDTLDRTADNPALALVKAQDGSNCVVNRSALATLLAIQEGLPGAPNIPGVTGNPAALLGACSGRYGALGLYNYAGLNVVTAPIVIDNAPAPNAIVNVGQGVPVSLRGKRLPNAPDWTVSVGAQYRWTVGAWSLTLRGDYYRQGDSYARIFNTATDRLKGYGEANATLILARPEAGLDVQVFVKNLTNAQPITNLYLGDDSSGLFTNSFTLDPRRYGVALTKRF